MLISELGSVAGCKTNVKSVVFLHTSSEQSESGPKDAVSLTSMLGITGQDKDGNIPQVNLQFQCNLSKI